MDRKIKGFTVFELLIVIILIGIIMAIIYKPITERITAHRVESEVKEIYGLLQEGRMLAFTRKEDLTFDISSGKACLKKGTEVIKCIQLNYNFNIKNGTHIDITDRGTFDPIGGGEVIYYNGNIKSPTVDCMVVSVTRVRMGVWNGNACILK